MLMKVFDKLMSSNAKAKGIPLKQVPQFGRLSKCGRDSEVDFGE